MTDPKTTTATTDDDLNVLLPEREIPLAGETVTIREYSLKDTLALHAVLAPVVDALATVTENAWASYETVETVLAEQHEAVIVLVAHSISKPPSFVAGLSGTEGMTLMDWWWSVNRHFFMTAVIRRLVCRQTTASGSAVSSPSLSTQAIHPGT
ncbi:hypothetical protein M8W91_002811 [Salmonella enterica]|nr:hypothetical protein [Salmonella enterica]EJF5856686.1 hypothetical protein [Salmonella enterica]EJF5948051.1 hypothetical protein [Salmonella enterica]EJF6158036.1 hypothetical protein [Salmonella enterica]EJF6377316.1 hypothetical protein [Salmonella enterica]